MPVIKRSLAAAGGLGLCLPLAAGCGGSEGSEGEELSSNEAGRTVFVEATPDDCQLTKRGAPPGEITFTVRNSGGRPVVFEVQSSDGDTIGRLPGVGGGLVRDLVVQLQVGEFATSCEPAGADEPLTGEFVVSDEDPGDGF